MIWRHCVAVHLRQEPVRCQHCERTFATVQAWSAHRPSACEVVARRERAADAKRQNHGDGGDGGDGDAAMHPNDWTGPEEDAAVANALLSARLLHESASSGANGEFLDDAADPADLEDADDRDDPPVIDIKLTADEPAVRLYARARLLHSVSSHPPHSVQWQSSSAHSASFVRSETLGNRRRRA